MQNEQKRMFLPPTRHDTTGGSEGTTGVFREFFRRDKVKTYSWTPAAKMWGAKVYELHLRVHSKGSLRRDSMDKHVRNRKTFKVCVSTSFSHQGMLLLFVKMTRSFQFPCSLFFSPGDNPQVAVVNRPLCTWTEFLAFVHFYHGRVTTTGS